MDYFSRKSLSKYLMINIELNKHDVDKKGQEGGLALESEVVAL
jgi:hypothetical protein